MSGLEPQPGRVLFNIISRQTGDFSDLTILCGETRIEVHQMIVCSQSKVLNTMCTIGFKETFSGEISMQEDCPIFVEKMVDFFYTNDYQLDPSDAENLDDSFSASSLQIHARMFALADKYDIGELCTLASSKYSWELMDSNSLVEFFDSIHDVYSLTPPSKRDLRDQVI
ncbi:Kelch domain-containing protein [Lasiodiplodia theobromae]|uniref:Kelch domain-containing protein n=1 Tax=Lasiodiplodia theobromae TaxID=45133 RepID=UPI0015C38D38|nr:Kelch domain-containing protein [Lasiodiplodia theobromae]KAF4534675.1 Kelch domain-containing protein [Lasiodiplodia theobromae]